MPFDWMHPARPAHLRARHEDAGRAAILDEARGRAALLRRLGYPEEHALHRCLGNIEWAHELCGPPAVTADEVREVVREAYAR